MADKMKTIASAGELDFGWARICAISGTIGLVAYVMVLAAESPGPLAVSLAFAFAFGIAVSSIGLYHVLGGAAGSRLALIAAVANVTATAQLLAMLLIQLAVKAVVPQPEIALKALWGGLDVAWDLYVGTGTVLFALAMFARRGLGAWFAAPGLLIGGLLVILNIVTFPVPPENAGLVDVGPLVGVWYLAVYLRVGALSALRRRQQRRSTAALERGAGPD